MSPLLQRFGNYLISRRADGNPVELARASDEVVFLAFDARIKRLVELHILKGGSSMTATERQAAYQRTMEAAEVRGSGFMKILEVGEDENMVFFTSNLNDGEFLRDYTARRGALPPTTAFCLMQQLLDELTPVSKRFGRLTANMRVANPLVTTLEDAFLQLRIVDNGLASSVQDEESDSQQRLAVECYKLLFHMLTGQAHEDQNPDRYPVLTALPMSLRTNLRTALSDPAQASPSLDRLRDDVREAYASVVSSLQVRNSRKHIVITDVLQPVSQLQELLLENVPISELLEGRYEIEVAEGNRRHAFAIPAINCKTEQLVTVHLLPPTRIVDKTEFEAVPLQMWRFNAERHPNILRSLSLWENPDWTFLTEEREPGFPLSRLLAERGTLNPTEVLSLLKQVKQGMEQAVECGVHTVDIHPSNLVFRVGKGGVMQAREFERLIAKRIDAWPSFVLKLRTHMTMRSLYEPLLAEPHQDAVLRETHIAARDYRSRSFIAFAVFLLTGERQMGSVPAFNEAVPEALANYLKECLGLQQEFGKAPSPGDFIAAFEQYMVQPDISSSAGQGFAAIMNTQRVAVEEMESAGSVSDFDDEWAESSPSYLVEPAKQKLGVQTMPIPAYKGPPKGLIGMIACGFAAVVLGLLAWFFLFPEKEARSSTAEATITPPVPEPYLAANQGVPEPPQPLPKADPVPQISEAAKPAPHASVAASIPPPAEVKTEPKPKETPLPPQPTVESPQPKSGISGEEIRRAIVPNMTEIEWILQGQAGYLPEPAENKVLVNRPR